MDVNNYSYTGPDFLDDLVTLAFHDRSECLGSDCYLATLQQDRITKKYYLSKEFYGLSGRDAFYNTDSIEDAINKFNEYTDYSVHLTYKDIIAKIKDIANGAPEDPEQKRLEIDSLFDRYATTQVDELDAMLDFLNRGYTLEDLSYNPVRYEWAKDFMAEHGLDDDPGMGL